MSTLARREEPFLDIDAFLAFLDERPGERWELFGGMPVAMAGGTLAHARIIGSLIETVRPLARKAGCDAFGTFFVETPDGSLFEPDLLVFCRTGSPSDRRTAQPTIVVEVLSASTLHKDRDLKGPGYRAIASLRQIVFVYQDSVRVETWHREGDGWSGEPDILLRRDRSLPLPALGTSLPMAAIYDGLTLPEPA